MDIQELKQKCLLELSGELTQDARRELFQHISSDPEACREYEAIREDYARLSLLPIPEPSAEERRQIPFAIKEALNDELMRPILRARRGRLLMRCAAMVTLVAMAGLTAWAALAVHHGESRRYAAEIARISAATESVAPMAQGLTAYELAVTDVEASIRQLETESPTLSNVYDKNLANLLDALASVPQVYDTGDWVGDEWSTRY